MLYEVPDIVSLQVGVNDTQLGFFFKLLMKAAKESGLPLSEQIDFANSILKLPRDPEERIKLFDKTKQDEPSDYRLMWAISDPTPVDGTRTIQDTEFKGGANLSYTLTPAEKADLHTRQLYYQMNGGILGTLAELSDFGKITVDLNIVYDPELITVNEPPQTKLEYVEARVKPKLQYWQETFYRIGILYTVRYNTGTVNASRTEITSGTLAGMVNIFWMNDPKSLKAYSRTETGNNQIFISEYKNDFMYDRAICHELGHVFGYLGITGMALLYPIDWLLTLTPIPNLISDYSINSALENMKNNRVKYGVDWIDDYRKAPTQIYYTPQISKLGPDATRRVIQREPTIYDYFRYGARMIKE